MRLLHLAALPLLASISVYSQTSAPAPGSPSPGAPASSAGPNIPQPSVGAQTYSVEGDILGYKALQSDGEAIACDVAGALAVAPNTPISPNGAGTQTAACKPSVSLSDTQILVLSSTDQTLANYQMWRVALLMIDSLQKQATRLIPPSAAPEPSTASFAATEAAVSTTLTLIQTVLSFFVSNEAVVGIQGTPQDVAIIDATTRQLRAMGAKVVVPTLYSPLGFSGLNYSKSPFLSKLNDLETTRGQLAAALTDKAIWDSYMKQISDDTAQTAKLKAEDATNAAQHKPAANTNEISRLSDEIVRLRKSASEVSVLYVSIGSISNAQLTAMIQSIDAFTASLLTSVPAPAAPTITPPSTPSPTVTTGVTPSAPVTGPTPNTGQPAAPGSQNQSVTVAQPATPSTPAVPPAATILLADGLARLFGATPTNVDPDISAWKILTIKEMEIGSTVVSKANIFGTKVSYAGGAIATYALFKMAGDEICSANVFDYGGRLRGKRFNDLFRTNDIDPSSQLIFSRGRCSLSSTIPPQEKKEPSK
jgi:hypothetical protein